MLFSCFGRLIQTGKRGVSRPRSARRDCLDTLPIIGHNAVVGTRMLEATTYGRLLFRNPLRSTNQNAIWRFVAQIARAVPNQSKKVSTYSRTGQDSLSSDSYICRFNALKASVVILTGLWGG